MIDQYIDRHDTSGEFGAIGHLAVGASQHHRAVFAMKSGHQAFRAHRTDLLGWEIDHRNNLATDQFFAIVQVGYLRAGFSQTDVLTKIDLQLVGGFARFGKFVYCDDGAHAELYFFKIIPPQSFIYYYSSNRWAGIFNF